MIGIVEIIIIAMLSLSTFLFAATTVSIKAKNTNHLATIVQLTIDKAAMSDEIDRLSFIVNNQPELNNGFIKFLSESREDSYKYIEEVQDAILDLKTSMDAGNDDMISSAYYRLIEFLPSSEQDQDMVN